MKLELTNEIFALADELKEYARFFPTPDELEVILDHASQNPTLLTIESAACIGFALATLLLETQQRRAT